MISSTQTNYAGQQGWNDCLPSTFLESSSSPSSSKKHSSSSKSHSKRYAVAPLPQALYPTSSSTSLHSLNHPPTDGPAVLPPPPMCLPSATENVPYSDDDDSLTSSSGSSSFSSSHSCSLSSSSSSLTTDNNSQSSSSIPSSSAPPSLTDNLESSSSSSSEPSILSQLEQVLSLPSTLPAREFAHYKVRLLKLVPELGPQHTIVVSQCLTIALDGNKSAARTEIVKHMMVHGAISSWAIPLRKVVESTVPETS
ncbi:uncharacterized protein SAPINGB_P001092 [Magnusiomyces paraingens]|uniref:Uncharacterized protein n=1 Tax=Magnusiomyces paraingens TaxID=2606893 RepID=A0A5E8B4J5_9ASCO|nr:uncharacterized protein SAPINGB_P001092 [Saprochaete ingens]VVT46193.1 unnamed protein product [Saprochaete ingens]